MATAESDATARRELAVAQSAHTAMADRYHRLNGEREALHGERAMLVERIGGLGLELAESQRTVAELQNRADQLQNRKSGLRSKIREQEEHLARLYAEIERLTGLIEAMEQTTAWKLHRKVEKLRGRT